MRESVALGGGGNRIQASLAKELNWRKPQCLREGGSQAEEWKGGGRLNWRKIVIFKSGSQGTSGNAEGCKGKRIDLNVLIRRQYSRRQNKRRKNDTEGGGVGERPGRAGSRNIRME